MSSGPLRIDVHQQHRVRNLTATLYQAAGDRFVQWCLQHNLWPTRADEWDDLLVEFKNDPETALTRHDFTHAVTAVKIFFPQFRKQLPWCDSIMNGWERTTDVKHTVPLPKVWPPNTMPR